MKLVDFYPLNASETYPRFGIVAGDRVIEIGESPKGTLVNWLQNGMPHQAVLQSLESIALQGQAVILNGHERRIFPLAEVQVCSPLNHPSSIRDFYAFEEHVATANRNRGRDVPKEWYEIPVFYFTNHRAIFGTGATIPYPVGSRALDYELEVAVVIGKEGRNITPEEAGDYIFGYMIYNDWSARDLQRQEIAVGLGPAKGKDFAQSFGPYLVTPDELVDKVTERVGVYDLEMVARVNGVERSRGNFKDIHYSFGEMIARASAGVTLYTGDVLGSGTVGTGCLLELTKGQGAYLKTGDVVELEIERLGVLSNIVGELGGSA